MRLALASLVLSIVVCSSPAFAQSPYVGVSLTGNIVRTSAASDILGDSRSFGDGESLGIGVRAGTAIGERWGLDAEVVYPGEIEWTVESPRFELSGVPPPGVGFSVVSPRQEYTARDSTFATTVWVKQSPGARLDLVYLGGIALVRSERAYRIDYELPFPIRIPDLERKYTSYTAAPVLGIDAPIRVTDHLRVVPGMRLMIFNNGLMVRPSVGATWTF